MAGRELQRRIASLFFSRQPHLAFRNEHSTRFIPSANIIFRRGEFHERGFQTLVESNKQATEDAKRPESCTLKTDSNPDSTIVSQNSNENSTVSYNAISNLKVSPRHDLAMIFTCKVCETRNTKTMCRESYEKGVVVARCGGCNNLHLIADHLGWFGEPGTIEELLAARGEEVRKGSVDTLNPTLEELAGKKS